MNWIWFFVAPWKQNIESSILSYSIKIDILLLGYFRFSYIISISQEQRISIRKKNTEKKLWPTYPYKKWWENVSHGGASKKLYQILSPVKSSMSLTVNSRPKIWKSETWKWFGPQLNKILDSEVMDPKDWLFFQRSLSLT